MAGLTQPSRTRRLLFEVAVAVVLLVILFALIAPHVGQASDDARMVVLLANLQTIRSHLEVYKVQHCGRYPDKDFIRQMLCYSNSDGETSDGPAKEYPFGPYLHAIRENPFSGMAWVRVVHSPRTRYMPPQQEAGWWYNAATGEFRADLTDLHKLPNGLAFNQL